MEKFRKLTPHDLAFGIGRKATKEELEELLSRPSGKGKPIDQAIEDIKKQLGKSKLKKAS
jgi:transposase